MNKNTLVVGVCGPAQSGKDTLVSILLDLFEHTNVNARRVAFADSLKNIYSRLLDAARNSLTFGRALSDVSPMLGPDVFDDAVVFLSSGLDWSDKVLDTPFSERTKEVHRRNLIDIGCYFRGVDENFWVRLALGSVHDLTDIVLVSDVRFENEAKSCDVIVKVVRPGTSIIYNPDHTQVDISEQFALTGRFDYLIDNSSTLGMLVSEAAGLVNDLVQDRVLKMQTNRIRQSGYDRVKSDDRKAV
jgi:hypothetical protein